MREHINYPPHMPFRGTLVGPLVRFRGDQVPVTSSPPRDTGDPRWRNCTDHHLACDCREAEYAELAHEYRSEWERLRLMLSGMLADHPTHVSVDGEERPDLACQCGLCAFARKSKLLDSYRWDGNHRDIRTGGRGRF